MSGRRTDGEERRGRRAEGEGLGPRFAGTNPSGASLVAVTEADKGGKERKDGALTKG